MTREALQNGPEWNAKEQAIKEQIRRFAFLEVGRELAELEPELRPMSRHAEEAVRWVQLRRVINEAAHPAPSQRFQTAAELGKAVAAARYADEYGPQETEPEPAAVTAPGPRRRPSLIRAAVFCPTCGRPETGGLPTCRSCHADLPPSAAAVQGTTEPDPDREAVKSWFAERGDEMAAKGNTTAAESAYRMAVYRNPLDAGAWSDLGDMYCINRKFPQALEAYQTATRLRPTDPTLRLDLGMALLANGKPKEAQQEFTAVLNTPTSAELRVAALCQLGAAFAAQGRHLEAIEVWRGVLEERPYDVGVHCSLAASYVATGNYPRAYEHLKIALRANPNSARAQMALRRLDRRLERQERGWDWTGLATWRLPLLVVCLLLGPVGLVMYLLGTAAYELARRVDWGELGDRWREAQGENEQGRRSRRSLWAALGEAAGLTLLTSVLVTTLGFRGVVFSVAISLAYIVLRRTKLGGELRRLLGRLRLRGGWLRVPRAWLLWLPVGRLRPGGDTKR